MAGQSFNNGTSAIFSSSNSGALNLPIRPKSTLGRRQRSDSTNSTDSAAAHGDSKRSKFSDIAVIENNHLARTVARTENNNHHSAALSNKTYTDAPHPQFSKYEPKTSIRASYHDIKVLVQQYVEDEDGLTPLGKVNLESLLTNDEYPSAKEVHELAKVYVRMVEYGVGEETRLDTIKRWFGTRHHLPADLIGEVEESFVQAGDYDGDDDEDTAVDENEVENEDIEA